MDKIDKIARAQEAWKAACKKRPGNRYTAEGEEAIHAAWPMLLALAAWGVGTLYLKEQPNASLDTRPSGGDPPG